MEIIVALKKLGEEPTPEERHILETSDDAMAQFEKADKAIGASAALEPNSSAVILRPWWISTDRATFRFLHVGLSSVNMFLLAIASGDGVLSVAGSSIKTAAGK